MPEMQFRIRWPDETEELCYSPSLVIEEHLVPGERYPLDAFLQHSRTALTIASERVRQRYGFPCSRALNQLAALEQRAARFCDTREAEVMVLGFLRI